MDQGWRVVAGNGVRSCSPYVIVLVIHTHTTVCPACGRTVQSFTRTSTCSLERHFSQQPLPSSFPTAPTCLRLVFISRTSGHCLLTVRSIEGYSFSPEINILYHCTFTSVYFIISSFLSCCFQELNVITTILRAL